MKVLLELKILLGGEKWRAEQRGTEDLSSFDGLKQSRLPVAYVASSFLTQVKNVADKLPLLPTGGNTSTLESESQLSFIFGYGFS
jgi:hypothetical protein